MIVRLCTSVYKCDNTLFLIVLNTYYVIYDEMYCTPSSFGVVCVWADCHLHVRFSVMLKMVLEEDLKF